MENYSHFIITRFILNLYAQDQHDLPTRSDRWVEYRFEVFERYCLPSVAAQTSGNFTWLCLFSMPRRPSPAAAVSKAIRLGARSSKPSIIRPHRRPT